MKINRPKNTKERGVIEFVVYKEKSSFVGVCLTFDIVEEGKNPTLLLESLKEAADLHLEVVRAENMSDDLLNRHAPAEYWQIYFEALKNAKKFPLDSFPMVSPYSSAISSNTLKTPTTAR